MSTGNGTALLGSIAMALAVLAWPSRGTRPAERVLRLRSPTVVGSAAGFVVGPDGAGQRMTDRFGQSSPQLPVAVILDLIAAALDAGLPVQGAVTEAFAATGDPMPEAISTATHSMGMGIAVGTAWAGVDVQYQPLVHALELAERSGASVGPVIRSTAADERVAQARRAHIAARRLGVQLVLPLGLTTLPSFMLLGVLPVVVGIAEPILRGL